MQLKRSCGQMLVKKLLVILSCLPLLATKPAVRLDRYLKGEISLVSYLNREHASIYFHFIHKILLAKGLDNDFVGNMPSVVEKAFWQSDTKENSVEDSLRHLLREDAPASWVFAKQYFLQGRVVNLTVTDYDQVHRLARLVERYGQIFSENDLHEAQTIISEARELARHNGDPFFGVPDDGGEEYSILIAKLDQLVYGVLLADTDGAYFFDQITMLLERFLSPLTTLMDDSQYGEEFFMEIGAVADVLNNTMHEVTEDLLVFDPHLMRNMETYLSGSEIEVERFIQFSLLHRQHFQLLIRHFSDQLDTEKFIDQYRALVEKHQQAYDPECLECMFTALDR